MKFSDRKEEEEEDELSSSKGMTPTFAVRAVLASETNRYMPLTSCLSENSFFVLKHSVLFRGPVN